MKANGSRTPALAFIFVTLLIDVLGFGLVIPVFPDLLKELSPVRGSLAAQASHSATELGLMAAVFGLMQFLFAPILGGLSDKYGRRPVLLVSLACAALDYVLCAMAPNLAWLFVGRVIAGITAASFTCASAYIADVSPPEKRAQNFGMIGAAFGAGFILGPALGGVVGGYFSLRAPFWVAAGLCGLNFLFGMFVLPESLAVENRREFDIKRANPFGTFKVLFKVQWVFLLVVALVFLYLAQQSLQATWTISGALRFGWKPSDMGWSLALIGAMSILVQMVILRKMLPRFGEAKTLMIGLVFQFIGFLGFGLATHSWIMFLMTAVWCLSFVGGPATQGIISKRFGDHEQGLVQGGLTSLQSVTGILGPLIATSVFAYFTAPNAPIYAPGAPFILGALFGVVTGGVAYWAMALRRSDAMQSVG
jgi:DHA1 family tetracycline resistance protein-like MFS transporter